MIYTFLIQYVDISSHVGTRGEIDVNVVLRPESDPETSDSDRDNVPDSHDKKSRKAEPHPEVALTTKRVKRRGSGRMHSGVHREAPAVTPHTASKATDDFGAMMRSTDRFFDRQEAAGIAAADSSSSSSSSGSSSNNNRTFQEMMALEELKGKNLALQRELLVLQQKHGL